MTTLAFDMIGPKNKNTSHQPGMLLRRISLIHNKQRPDIAPISNAYQAPERGDATIPDGAWCDYTPASDDSTISVSVSLYYYRGNSVYLGYPYYAYQDQNLQFSYIWQFGNEYVGKDNFLGGGDQAYLTFKFEVPSWGEGKTKRIAFRMTNYDTSGYYRCNISYNYTMNVEGRLLSANRPKMIVEEYASTEPLSTAVIPWDENNVDY